MGGEQIFVKCCMNETQYLLHHPSLLSSLSSLSLSFSLAIETWSYSVVQADLWEIFLPQPPKARMVALSHRALVPCVLKGEAWPLSLRESHCSARVHFGSVFIFITFQSLSEFDFTTFPCAC